MKALKIISIIVISLAIVFFVGPREHAPNLNVSLRDTLPSDLHVLQTYIKSREANEKFLKPENEALIEWANPDSAVQTDFAVVYLHGFSASRAEGNGIYTELAKRYNANLYLPRLYAHGIQTENNLLDFSIEKFWESAQEAYLIGKKLGKKVILVGTSTGATLSLMLASQYDDIQAVVIYSPNIDLAEGSSEILRMPWGLQITRLAMGGKFRTFEATPEQQKYWQNNYRLEALVKLKVMLHAYMTPETFAKIKSPVFMGYYFKNETEQDDVVSVPAMLSMYEQLGTPADLKTKVSFPNAGEHVFIWKETSACLPEVQKETFAFTDKILLKK